jgi:hypothetical protein
MNSGTPANMAASTSPYVSMASSIKPSSGMAGMHQDTYVTGQSAALFIHELLDAEELPAAVLGVSLASSQEHGTPCHQPSMDKNHIEALSQESPTIIPSKPMTVLKAYQIKLVIQKNKESERKSATTYSDSDVYV